MLVSVITPNYNCAAYVGRAIESVRSQTFRDWELLVVDDCSTDGSVEIIRGYAEKDRRIRFLQTPSHSGSPLEPRNLALEKAQGRYIAFLDSDDLWLPGKLERQLKLFENEKTAIVFSNYEKINGDGVRSGRLVRSPAVVSYRDLLKSNCIGNLTAVYDTEKAGKVFFRHPCHEDYVLWLTILEKGFVAENTGTVEALYRMRADSVSARKVAALKWQWEIYRKELKLPLPHSVCFFVFSLARGFLKYIR
jgi:glycosyltransferase involved in cell wall biosynthesis